MFSVADVYCTFVIGYAGCVWVNMFNGDLYFGDDIIVNLGCNVPVRIVPKYE